MRYTRRHKSKEKGSGLIAFRKPTAYSLQPTASRLQPPASRLQPARRAVTLVEMLIVVSIIMILMVITLKAMPKTEDRRVREAAREVNVYLSSARNRAMELGRSCGVLLHRTMNNLQRTTLIDQCEGPQPFAGDVINAVVKVQDFTNTPSSPRFRLKIRSGDCSEFIIRPGDRIRLNNQGPFYRISLGHSLDSSITDDFPGDPNGIYFDLNAGSDTDGDGFIDDHFLYLTLDIQDAQMQQFPWPYVSTGLWSTPVSFLIERLPVKTAATPLQLPEGTALDLNASGTDNLALTDHIWNNWILDVLIIFSPNGSLEAYYFQGSRHPASQPLFLMVGKRDRVRDYASDPLPASPNLNELPNWADLSSTWVTINYQTGMVSTSENSTYTGAPNWTLPGTDASLPPGPYVDCHNWQPFVNQTRNIARQEQSMGGR